MTDPELDYLDHAGEELGAPDQERFRIDDDSKADWALRKIAQIRAAMARRAAFVKQEVERLKRWQEERDRQDEAAVAFFTELLHVYYVLLREQGALGKRKSYKLPHGALQMRAASPKWRRVDDDALVAWAEGVDQSLVRITKAPAWSEISKRLRPAQEMPGAPAVDGVTGEVVPGVLLDKPAGDEFSVKVEGSDD